MTQIIRLHVPAHPLIFIFFVIQDRTGYTVLYHPSDKSFGYLCPGTICWVMRNGIQQTVMLALSRDQIEGKVRWCCHKDDINYGDTMGNDYSPLKQEYYCAGSANADLSTETKDLIHKAALSKY